MPNEQDLNAGFPGATSSAKYLAKVDRVTTPLGFDRESSFAAVSLCRDELTQSFLHEVEERWQRPFVLGGLGGLPSLGHTGWQACLAHVPCDDGRGHLIVFAMPHIGLDSDGRFGQTLRRNQNHTSSACGAMGGLVKSLTEGATPAPAGLDDREAQRFEEVMRSRSADLPHEVVALTKVAAEAIDSEIWAELDALAVHETMDVAVFTAVQIHVQDDFDHIWPVSSSFRGSDGQRLQLDL